MVATIAQMASAEYYLESQKSYRHPNEYYIAGKEPDGAWLNPTGLFGLSDGGKIDSKDFERLYNGFGPENREPLTRNAGTKKRSPGIDMTFSADKSISALWALLPTERREEIEKIMVEAARAALEDTVLKYCSFTRLETDGQEIVAPADIMAATFLHRTSRENDPQLHVHSPIFNVARTHADGKFRAHHQYPAYSWKMAAGAAFRNYLAWELQQKFGVVMEQYGPAGEFTRIAGMPEELQKLWSKRRNTMLAMADKLGIPTIGNAARMAGVNTMTRSAKSQDNTTEADCERFGAEASTVVDIARLIAAVTGKIVEITAAQIRKLTETLQRLPQTLGREEAVFQRAHIMAAVWNKTAGRLPRAASQTSIERVFRNEDIIALDRRKPSPEAAAGMAHTELYSTRPTIEMEQSVRDMAKKMAQDSGYQLTATATQDKIDALLAEGYPLDGKQIQAIHAATSSDGRIAIIEGAAGSGKTTTLRPIADLFRENGQAVIPTAVAWRTAVALGHDINARPVSVHKLLSMARREQITINRNTVIIVDEAGMLSTLQMQHILQLSERHSAKIIFAGDTKQQQPVEAGPGLRLTSDVAGSVRVDTIRRQKADAEDILIHVHGQTPETASFQAGLMAPAERERIIADYEAMENKPHFTPWQITASKAFRDGEAEEAITAYRDHGRFHLCHNDTATLKRLVDDWARYKRDNTDKSTIVLARTRDEVTALSYLMRSRTLPDNHSAGQPAQGRPAPADGQAVIVEVSRDNRNPKKTEPLEIAVGDRLRIGTTHWEKQLFNGTVVTVEDFKVRRSWFSNNISVQIHGRTDDGRSVSFVHDEIRDGFGNIRLDYGYAMTITSAQGMTVDRAFLLADDKPARETLYPAATRHREQLDIYVNRQPIALAIEQTRPDDRSTTPVTDADIRAHLAKRWARSAPKEAAHDYMSPEMQMRMQPQGPDTGGAANDNAISRISKQVRLQAFGWRHGGAVAAFADGHREVVEAYDGFRARVHAGETAVALEPAFAETLTRHRALLNDVATPDAQSPIYRQLLTQHSGIDKTDLDAFKHLYKKVDTYRRSTLATAGKSKARDHEQRLPAGQMDAPTPATKAAQLALDLKVAPTPALTEQQMPRPATTQETAPDTTPADGVDARDQGTLTRELYAELVKDCEKHLEQAAKTGMHFFYASGYNPLIERMQSLATKPGLSEHIAQDLARHLKLHQTYIDTRQELTDYLTTLERSNERRDDLISVAKAADRHLTELPSYKEWREQSDQLIAAGKNMLIDNEAYAIHLKHSPEGKERIERALKRLRDNHIQDDKTIFAPQIEEAERLQRAAARLEQKERSRTLRLSRGRSLSQ